MNDKELEKFGRVYLFDSLEDTWTNIKLHALLEKWALLTPI